MPAKSEDQQIFKYITQQLNCSEYASKETGEGEKKGNVDKIRLSKNIKLEIYI